MFNPIDVTGDDHFAMFISFSIIDILIVRDLHVKESLEEDTVLLTEFPALWTVISVGDNKLLDVIVREQSEGKVYEGIKTTREWVNSSTNGNESIINEAITTQKVKWKRLLLTHRSQRIQWKHRRFSWLVAHRLRSRRRQTISDHGRRRGLGCNSQRRRSQLSWCYQWKYWNSCSIRDSCL